MKWEKIGFKLELGKCDKTDPQNSPPPLQFLATRLVLKIYALLVKCIIYQCRKQSVFVNSLKSKHSNNILQTQD